MNDDVRIESDRDGEEEEPEVCTRGAGSDSKGYRKDGVVFLGGLRYPSPRGRARVLGAKR